MSLGISKRDCLEFTITLYFLGKRRNCGATGHKARHCLKVSPPTDADRSTTTSTVAIENPQKESLEERCHRLQNISNERMVASDPVSTRPFTGMPAMFTSSHHEIRGQLLLSRSQLPGSRCRQLMFSAALLEPTVVRWSVRKLIFSLVRTSLHPVDVILRDYNRNPIPMGA